jgi:hypothetical protein
MTKGDNLINFFICKKNFEQDFDKCKDNTNIMVQKLDDLGYRINRKKSVLIPTKRIVFFGLIIDTEVFKVFLTDEKVDIERIINIINTPYSQFAKKGIYRLQYFSENSRCRSQAKTKNLKFIYLFVP